MSPATVSRRGLLIGGGGLVAAGGAAGAVALERARHAEVPLYSETVAFSAPFVRTLVPAGRAESLVPGTRVLADCAERSRLVDDEEAWLGGCAPWVGRVRDDGLLRSALLDLRALTTGLPAAVAGWTDRWRYAWPRDTAFVAVALARVGRPDEAMAQLSFLQAVQREDGWFEARYDVRTGTTPDDRPPQLDGVGWTLWAAAEVGARFPDDASRLLAPVRPMLVRCARRLLASRDAGTGVPSPSSDYWELVEHTLTLGTAAAVLVGLRSGTDALTHVGEMALADRTRQAADELDAQLHRQFGATGYPRHLGDDVPDAAVTFLVAPIGPREPSIAVLQAVDRAQTAMARPAGGLAPGAGWKQDGISWTPETALFAAAWAANGFPDRAARLLDWLGAHRTDAGSLPEKVLHDGRPAAVAPLAWTASLVVIAQHEMVTA
ncbi:hypothetical protein [Phycicoccus avicenniae]|uniref:hypothetical protein n=1 Tax=Phycicoccus avicenniae TaxID=2828860 RepID=UPI003D26726D